MKIENKVNNKKWLFHYFKISKIFKNYILKIFGSYFVKIQKLNSWSDSSSLIPSCIKWFYWAYFDRKSKLLWSKKFWFCVVLLNGVLLNEGRQWWNLLVLGYDQWTLAGTPWPKTVGFSNLVGAAIAPVSKKLTVFLYAWTEKYPTKLALLNTTRTFSCANLSAQQFWRHNICTV